MEEAVNGGDRWAQKYKEVRDLYEGLVDTCVKNGTLADDIGPRAKLSHTQAILLQSFVTLQLFRDIKFVNNETLRSKPVIIEACFFHLGVKKSERLKRHMLVHAITTRLKYLLAQRRSYIKGNIEIVFRGRLFFLARDVDYSSAKYFSYLLAHYYRSVLHTCYVCLLLLSLIIRVHERLECQ